MGKKTNLKGRLVMAIILLWLAPAIAAGGVIYVDVNTPDNNDGSSWAKAYRYLQDALAVAEDGNDVWVAQGIYEPDANSAEPNGTGDRTATFQLINGVAIYGGFAGGESSLDERDWQTNETILSGDLNGDDVGFTNNGENSYHVVTGSGTDANAVFDGFTVTAGNANGYGECPGCTDHGGGMFNWFGSPTVSNCTFIGNSAKFGSGMFNGSYSSPEVTNCTFYGNVAEGASSSSNSGGAGMANDGHSSPHLTNCSFSANRAISGSGQAWGGGLANWNFCEPNLTNCTFTGNRAASPGGQAWGGGMNNYGSSPTVTNCTFSGNWAGENGGGMANYDNSSPTVTNCTFSGNWAANGGGMLNNAGSPTVTNCAFSANSGGESGGGMYNHGTSNPTLTNCILWGNTAPSDAQIYNDGTSSSTVSYSDVEGGWPGTGNIDDDPLFVDANGLDGIAGTADDEEGYVHLRGYSPCINAGDPGGDYSGQVDIDGQPRVAYGRADMGADEVFPIAGDAEPDGDVDFVDVAFLANHWLFGP